jgi:hypothetical protein
MKMKKKMKKKTKKMKEKKKYFCNSDLDEVEGAECWNRSGRRRTRRIV